MVSGFFTSPLDQDRTRSGEAMEMDDKVEVLAARGFAEDVLSGFGQSS